MTPDERDRLLRLELNAENQGFAIDRVSDKVDGLGDKVDALLKAAHMGQGAWWLLLRIGAVLAALIAAAAWLIDKIPLPHR